MTHSKQTHNLTRRFLLASAAVSALAAAFAFSPEVGEDAFRQLHQELPTPGPYRTASGAPGHEYWQQKVDYKIDVHLDEELRHINAVERITYHNHSPDALTYLWVALDPNIMGPESHSVASSMAPSLDKPSYGSMHRFNTRRTFDGTCHIEAVLDAAGEELHTAIQDTMMRVDLPEPLKPSEAMDFTIAWNYAINNSKEMGGRTGYEHFEKDDNVLFEMAQWFPRLCAYSDLVGWQNKEFLGSGEFTLEFGDYTVSITVPEDHVVASTGVLQNSDEVLLLAWKDRLTQAKQSGELTFIVTPEEAKANEEEKATGTKTWTFQAENVRDFAWASSRKFIWDALYQPVEGVDPVLAMSFYPNEGEPLWSRYSTRAVAHTLVEYSKHTFPYPYPVAISVNGPVGGMEYPMICFNGPRPEEDGTYSKRTKYGLIGVVIHEVGHNWFPMIVNSDERQWTWMDEGLNTFVQFLAEQAWEEKYPGRRGEARHIVGYMSSENQRPIMTGSEELLQFGSNAYAKPATALNILRETVMGRELFDFAFKEYSNRWRFKRPEPADLFRTLEDASAVDLDWFWRGWFFSTDSVDQALTHVTHYRMGSPDPAVSKAFRKQQRDSKPESITVIRNKGMKRLVETYPELLDFYNEFDDLDVTPQDTKSYEKFLEDKKIEGKDRALYEVDDHFYVVTIERIGELVMPVIVDVELKDGSHQEFRWPVQVWRRGNTSIKKLILTDQEVVRFTLDPHLEIADTELFNNHWPRKIEEKRIDLQENRKWGGGGKNPMQKAKAAAEGAKEEEEKVEEVSGASPKK
ncbi:MAG: M1 family metallopeptidase [bacterium]|nr:M1 family metallopeptidase [bacterium]